MKCLLNEILAPVYKYYKHNEMDDTADGTTTNYTKWNKLLKIISQKQVYIVKLKNFRYVWKCWDTLALALKETYWQMLQVVQRICS
jgi:hypothetical protein